MRVCRKSCDRRTSKELRREDNQPLSPTGAAFLVAVKLPTSNQSLGHSLVVEKRYLSFTSISFIEKSRNIDITDISFVTICTVNAHLGLHLLPRYPLDLTANCSQDPRVTLSLAAPSIGKLAKEG